MGIQTGSTYISATMRHIKILTANLGFRTIESSKKLSASDFNSDQQPEITIWPQKPEMHINPELGYDRYHRNSNCESGIIDYGDLDKSVAK